MGWTNSGWRSDQGGWYKNAAAAATTTWDAATATADVTLSGDKLAATNNANANNGIKATASHSTGKYFFSVVYTGDIWLAGISNAAYDPTAALLGSTLDGVGIFNTSLFLNNGGIGEVDNIAAGDVIDIAVDLGAKLIFTRKNGGLWWGDFGFSGVGVDPVTGTHGASFAGINAGPYLPTGWSGNSGRTITANFGATAYTYAPPSGYGNW